MNSKHEEWASIPRDDRRHYRAVDGDAEKSGKKLLRFGKKGKFSLGEAEF
jgi:hypothetical protein